MKGRPLADIDHPVQQFLIEQNIMKKSFAEKLGISVSHLNFILSGQRRPSLGLALRIVRATGDRIKFEELLPEKDLVHIED